MELLDIIQQVVTTLAAGAGGLVAVFGLRTWRKQLRGKTEYELARRLLRASLKVRDEFAYVRGALIMGGEIAAAVEEAGADIPLDDPKAAELARSRRWKHLADAWSDLEVEVLEAEVLWGSEAQEWVSGLRKHMRAFKGASWEYGFLEQSDRPLEEDERVRLVELRRQVFGTGGDDDEFATGIDEAISELEAHLRPHLDIESSPRVRLLPRL